MMVLALFCTMSAAVLFQPALMGPPRKVAAEEGRRAASRCLPTEDEDEFEPVGRARRRVAQARADAERQREDETVSR